MTDSSSRKNSDNTRPHGQWFPDKGERVFVPLFDSMGTVLEICPRLTPEHIAAEAIYYLVELDMCRSYNHAAQVWREYKNEKTLLLAEEMISSAWVGKVSSSPPSGD